MAKNLFRSSLCYVTMVLGLLICSYLLLTTHQEPHCQYQILGKDWDTCMENKKITCQAPAIEVQTSMGIFGAEVKFDLSCPWGKETSTVSLIAIYGTFAFLILFALNLGIKSFRFSNFLVVFGVFSLLGLFTSLACMVIDLREGAKIKPSDYRFFRFNSIIDQTMYLINAGALALVFIGVLVFTVRSFRNNPLKKQKGGLLDHEEPAYNEFYSSA